MTAKNPVDGLPAIHPGEFLRETLKDLAMTLRQATDIKIEQGCSTGLPAISAASLDGLNALALAQGLQLGMRISHAVRHLGA